MLIKTLDHAEKIVEKNPMLEWDGWTIVQYKRNNAGWMQKNGAFKNGHWYETRQFIPNRRGWNIPDRLAKKT